MTTPTNPAASNITRLGVCSWSLRPAGPAELVSAIHACGLHAVQLALEPLRSGDWDITRTASLLADAGITVASGMMACRNEDYSTLESIRQTGGLRPDRHWPHNLAAAVANAALAKRLGLRLVTLHAGFLPDDPADPLRPVMLDRLRQVADIFADSGVSLGLETGQESADTLAHLLTELAHPTVGVNFDPANMILYAMGDPTASLQRLAPWVLQVHIKDAVPTETPGTWGRETPAGQGAVDWPAFFAALTQIPRPIDLMIEREASQPRITDVNLARQLIERHLPHLAGSPHA